MKINKTAALYAILAAALYAINVPISKILLHHVDAAMMAALLYLGAGVGLLLYSALEKLLGRPSSRQPLTKRDLPYTVGMVVLDIAAPILLMAGIARTTSGNVSLLNNFEIVATSVILSFENAGAFTFNTGSLLVLGACLCWGFENNCTKMLSSKSSVEIVTIKGCFSGLGSLCIALLLGEDFPNFLWTLTALILGFVSYGLSINFYILAQKDLGAARTSAYYSIAPFLGVAFSILLLGEQPTLQFCAALVIMVLGTVLMASDNPQAQ